MVKKLCLSEDVLRMIREPDKGINFIKDSGDLNTKLVRYSVHGICLLVNWFAIQTTIIVRYSDHYLVNGLVFSPPFEYQSAIQMPSTMVPSI